ncbi:trace amine-associated receptor 4-like [Protopterus annectens]|uniref:trace amine-associated receptor 4-like n=1 Tax=Protopterus annectens TaxID=7888 RepID=UPI001CFB2DE9|nr:trace amine-associated receptor 4-like [Protopterus annectens]
MNISAFPSLDEASYCFPSVNRSCIRNSLPTTVTAVLYTLLVGIIITVICGNLLVIISVSHFKELHTPTNFLTLSLAVTDFLVGLLVLPFSMVRTVEACWYFGNTFCKIHSAFDMAFTTVSIFHLCAIAVDRYYTICDPLHYSLKITLSAITIFLFVCWMLPICLTYFLVFFGQNVDEMFLASVYCEGLCISTADKTWALIIPVVNYFLPASAMICIYLKIFIVARKHAKIINGIVNKVSSVKKHVKQIKASEQKATKTLILIMGIFLFCWLPVIIVILLTFYFNIFIPSFILEALSWLAYFNSGCNPIVYGFFYPWFQLTFKMVLNGKIFTAASSTFSLSSENH